MALRLLWNFSGSGISRLIWTSRGLGLRFPHAVWRLNPISLTATPSKTLEATPDIRDVTSMAPLHEGFRKVPDVLASLLPFPVNHKHVWMLLLRDRSKLHFTEEVSYNGKKALKPMQRHIARILAKPHKGVNPNAVLLTYRSGTLDPRICAILRAARSARRAIHTMPIVFKDFWSKLVNDPGDPNRTYGPMSVLAAYFKSLGIKPHAGGYLTLQGISPVDFIDGPFTLIEEILLTAWARQVQAELRERNELEDLANVSPELTYRALKKLEPKDAKVVRTYLCGGFPTNSQAHHWKNIQTDCPCCGAQDTRAHRIKRCCATGEVRQEFTIIDALSETQAAAPWAIHTEERSTIAKLIQGIPFPSVERPVRRTTRVLHRWELL